MGHFGFARRSALLAVALFTVTLFGLTASVATAGIPGHVYVMNRHKTTVITVYINDKEVGKIDGDSSFKYKVGDVGDVTTKLVAKAEGDQVWTEMVITPNKGQDHEFFVRPK